MKINFSAQTVTGEFEFSFRQMSMLEDMLTLSAMESDGSDDSTDLNNLSEIAGTLGIDITDALMEARCQESGCGEPGNDEADVEGVSIEGTETTDPESYSAT